MGAGKPSGIATSLIAAILIGTFQITTNSTTIPKMLAKTITSTTIKLRQLQLSQPPDKVFIMRRIRPFIVLIAFSLLGSITLFVEAEDELAATLEVLSAGVEVKRDNTLDWLPVTIESIVGVGDTIRTDETGRARITYFADGTDTEILPSTEYRIAQFAGTEDAFTLEVEVLIGQTIQRLSRLLETDSSYDLQTPGMELAARGTQFAIRVETTGRSAMLVSEGAVEADSGDDAAGEASESAEVPVGFGVRAAVDETLSDVVRASTFAELDAALDGCAAAVTTPDDVRINVRSGPSRDFPVIGSVDATEVTVLMGKTESSGWYRLDFDGQYGWILSSTAVVDRSCAGLRSFSDDYSGEAENDTGDEANSTPETTATPTGAP